MFNTISSKVPPVILLALLFLVGCQSLSQQQPAQKSEARDASALHAEGPFRGLRWPATKPSVGSYLHDDGKRLVAYRLDGTEMVLWEHPPAEVTELAVSPAADELALVVNLPSKNPAEISSVLYVLKPGGAVEVADAVEGHRVIQSPVYLRPTDRPAERPQLYWVRWDEGSSGIRSTVMVLGTRGPRPVKMDVRFGESVSFIQGYPGGTTFSIFIKRLNDLPTSYEVVQNQDSLHSVTRATGESWLRHEFRANTDSKAGAAWITPFDFVLPVASQRLNNERNSLRLFRSECGHRGSAEILRGSDIDWGIAVPWFLLPTNEGGVLVVKAEDMNRAYDEVPNEAFWYRVDLFDGRITKTNLTWKVGAWAWVAPEAPTHPHPQVTECPDYEMEYPGV